MLQSFPLVRLAALDLDGTLLNRNNEVTLATRQAIARAVEHGVVVVPATGRPLASLPPVVAKLPGIRYAITSNGAAVWDLGDDPMGAVHSRYANAAQRHTSEPACLLHRLMPTEVAREAFDLFQQYDGELSVFSDGLAIKTPEGIAKLTSRTARFLSSEARQNLTDGRFTVIPGIESWMSRHAHEIEKLCMFFDSTEKTAAALPKFQAIPGVAVVQGSPDNIEVTAAGAPFSSSSFTTSSLWIIGPNVSTGACPSVATSYTLFTARFTPKQNPALFASTTFIFQQNRLSIFTLSSSLQINICSTDLSARKTNTVRIYFIYCFYPTDARPFFAKKHL